LEMIGFGVRVSGGTHSLEISFGDGPLVSGQGACPRCGPAGREKNGGGNANCSDYQRSKFHAFHANSASC